LESHRQVAVTVLLDLVRGIGQAKGVGVGEQLFADLPAQGDAELMPAAGIVLDLLPVMDLLE
jgi:hypothetical protein